MKKLLMVAALGAGLVGSNAQAGIDDLLVTVDKITKFDETIKERKEKINIVLGKIKISKGAEKADQILELTDLGLAFLNDVSEILSGGILGISSVISMVPSQKAKEAAAKLNSLIYLTPEDESKKMRTGAIGASLGIIRQMSSNMSKFRTMLENQEKNDAEMKQKMQDYEQKLQDYEKMLKDCGKSFTPIKKEAQPAAQDEDLLF